LAKHVKGPFFAHYARMILAHPEVDWSRYLQPEDLLLIQQKIQDDQWYPYDTFKRMGDGILAEIGRDDPESVRQWGEEITARTVDVFDTLVSVGDPRETLIRLQVLRRGYFDFEPVEILILYAKYAKLKISYGMSPPAEKAAVYQTLSLIERLIERSGATNLHHRFTSRSWHGQPATIIELEWSEVPPERRVKGAFLVDYIRMIKNRKEVDWMRYLLPEDRVLLDQPVQNEEWYSFRALERVGMAIFQVVSQGDVELAREWGHMILDNLVRLHESLICENDPRESLMRYQVARRIFFDFEPINIKSVSENLAKLELRFDFCRQAEEFASYQMLGSFERLLELSGASNLHHRFTSKAWEGDPATILELEWSEVGAGRKVKGILFMDYVKMLHARRRDVNLNKYLLPADRNYLNQRIEPKQWYPFAVFERMGVAIVTEIAQGNMDSVRIWGRFSMDGLIKEYPDLLCPDDPRESLMRCQVLRRSFFDFNPMEIRFLSGNYVKLEIGYNMCKLAEEAATYQSVGFFERLLELSGAKQVHYQFNTKAWAGDPTTILELKWE